MLILRTYAYIAPLYPFPSLVPIYLRDLPPYDTFAQLWPLRMQTRGDLIQKRPRISTYLSESFSAICWIFPETFWLSKYENLARLIKKWPRWGRGDPLGLPLTCWKGGRGWPVGVAPAQGEMGSGQGEYWPV